MDMQEKSVFCNSLRDIFVESLAFIRGKEVSPYINRHAPWPQLSYRENGMPSVYSSQFNGPINYTSILLESYREVKSLQPFISMVCADEALKSWFLPDGHAEKAEYSEAEQDVSNIMIAQMVFSIIDRYIHTYNSSDFEEGNFQKIYAPIEQGIFEEKLYVDIAIPLLYVNCSFEELHLADTAYIRRMDDQFQLSRSFHKAYGPGVHDNVLEAATHALFLKDYWVSNRGSWNLSRTMANPFAYPIERINLFFASIRIETGVKTGYAQLLLVPQGWGHHSRANLPFLQGTSIPAYPRYFEDYYWLKKDLPSINEAMAKQIGNIWELLSKASDNSLKLAARRLNNCFLREENEDEDIAIDATIGLEALLSDDDKNEMTHKLALRVAALSRHFKEFQKSPYQAFQDIKKIYSYRSSVVHGSSSSDRKREIKVSENHSVLASELAVDYLRRALKLLIADESLRKPLEIDKRLLLQEGRDSITPNTVQSE